LWKYQRKKKKAKGKSARVGTNCANKRLNSRSLRKIFRLTINQFVIREAANPQETGQKVIFCFFIEATPFSAFMSGERQT